MTLQCTECLGKGLIPAPDPNIQDSLCLECGGSGIEPNKVTVTINLVPDKPFIVKDRRGVRLTPDGLPIKPPITPILHKPPTGELADLLYVEDEPPKAAPISLILNAPDVPDIVESGIPVCAKCSQPLVDMTQGPNRYATCLQCKEDFPETHWGIARILR